MGKQKYYSSKAKSYSRYRLDYSIKATNFIIDTANLNKDSSVADIGSGTGILSKHFVDKVQNVYAVEPDDGMREIAEEMLGRNKSFHSIDGTSDQTHLSDSSIELICVGQAIHWLDPKPTKDEFIRILKPDGWLAILWYEINDKKLNAAYEKLRTKDIGWDNSIEPSRPPKKPLEYYFGVNKPERKIFTENFAETWEGFLGSAYSQSFAPNSDEAISQKFELEHKKVFERFAVSGRIIFPYSTHLVIGQPKF